MDHSNVPFELISYRGLLKSLEDIKNGNFFKNRHFEKFEMLSSTKTTLLLYMFSFVNFIENFLFFLMSGYDNFVYTPLQKSLSPIVKIAPRYLHIGGHKIPIFTANIVTLSRTFLIVPIAWLLKFDYNTTACLCVVFHDFLDHLDGIVAKVHKITYPEHDDPILGGFLDAFCDKIVNVISIWTIIQYTNFELVSFYEASVYLFICYAVISYETVIGIVRVQDFFKAMFKRDYKIEDEKTAEPIDAAKVTAASMEGKLKEKLESTGIAMLCLSVCRQNENPINNIYGLIGLICLLLTLRMAHKSLILKLKARKANPIPKAKTLKYNYSADNVLHLMRSESTDGFKHDNQNFELAEMKMVNFSDNQNMEEDETFYEYKKKKSLNVENLMTIREEDNSTNSVKELEADNRVDKVYTIGCFDLFHFGHVKLLNRMKEIGKKVIVGVHDSKSIYKLKNRVPIDSTEKRMLNVKTIADEVFCIAGCDPSNYMTCIVNLSKNETALFVRGDDMPNFPSRQVVENLMPIKLLPYTDGVSSTQLRKQNFSHIVANDESYLEKNE